MYQPKQIAHYKFVNSRCQIIAIFTPVRLINCINSGNNGANLFEPLVQNIITIDWSVNLHRNSFDPSHAASCCDGCQKGVTRWLYVCVCAILRAMTTTEFELELACRRMTTVLCLFVCGCVLYCPARERVATNWESKAIKRKVTSKFQMFLVHQQ